MRILIACEESQRVCTAFRRRGHEAYSCDVIDCSGGHPEWHIKRDVIPLVNGRCEFKTCDGKTHKIESKWDMIIAHPPCTYLSNVGSPLLFNKDHAIKNKERYEAGVKAKEFFIKILNCDCEKIVIENPTPMKIWKLPDYTQAIQPYFFGEPFKKRTCLWIKGLNKLYPTAICKNPEPTTKADWYNKGGKDKQKNRSKTFLGIAKAMADQWG